MQKRIIEIEESKDKKPVLKVGGIYLHSKFYPEREAEKFIDSNKEIFRNKDRVVVYGLGLGYHVRELLKHLTLTCNLDVYDIDAEIYDIGKKLGCYTVFMNDNRIKLHIGMDCIKDLSEKLELVEDILIYEPSLSVLPSDYEQVKSMFKNFTMARYAIEKSKDIMKENYLHNLKENFLNIREFLNKSKVKGKPVVVAAAGPSLDYNIEELRQINGKISIFCVGSALRTLVKNGIIPDMICIIDCSELVYNQLKGYENSGIPLCFLSTASRWAVSKYMGPKYMFYNKENESNDVIINTAKTVAVSAIDIAVKAQAKEIVLVGQDLAFLNNKTHTDCYSEIYGVNDQVESESKLYKKVEGVNGKILNTRSEYLNFKHYIELEIEKNKSVSFINCSSGAKIKGTKYMKLSDWIKENM